MTAQYTPGPWRSEEAAVWDECGDLIADCANWTYTDAGQIVSDDCEANARLIASAPDLLEVLGGIKWSSADKDNMEFAARITYSQMDRILAALAKAKGGEA